MGEKNLIFCSKAKEDKIDLIMWINLLSQRKIKKFWWLFLI
jgi:hypothetical protein